ncbi:MAG: hypothetical protein COA45_04845 [Zetaproteobacteria bacterium]|nr:MAG: hypothetical protein COA45_04845 [Zetaproteobacteria bacterium]
MVIGHLNSAYIVHGSNAKTALLFSENILYKSLHYLHPRLSKILTPSYHLIIHFIARVCLRSSCFFFSIALYKHMLDSSRDYRHSAFAETNARKDKDNDPR